MVKGIIVAITIGIIVIAGGVLIVSSKVIQLPQQLQPQSQEEKTAIPILTPIPTSAPIFLSGLEIAQRTAKFLDSTIKPDDTFHLLYNCHVESKDCALATNAEQVRNGQVILAYKDLFQETQDQSYKQKADKAMDSILKACQENDDYCIWNFFALYEYYKETNDQRYKSAMLKVADKGLEPGKPLISYLNLNAGNKIAILYDITGDKKYKEQLEKMAQDTLSGALDNATDNPVILKMSTDSGEFPIRKKSLHIMWDFYLPAYKVSGNSVYLQPIKEFFDNVHTPTQVSILFQAVTNSDLDEIAELALALSEDFTDGSIPTDDIEKYRLRARTILESLLVFWDTPEHTLYTGDYGFLSSVLARNVTIKETLINGWQMRLFLKMKTQQFTVPTRS